MEAELPIVLDRASPVPFAAQLAGRLREAILEGTLRPEHTLPASRRLAAELGVSRGVVVRAYEQISGEGYLESRGSAGTRVAVRFDGRGTPAPKAAPKPATAPKAVIDLTPGRPSGEPFRDREWRSAWKKAIAGPVQVGLPPASGMPALRAALARHLGASRGLTVDAADIVITAGTSDALQLISTALRSKTKGPRILVEDPGYPTARRVLSAAGAVVEVIPVGEDGAEASRLDALGSRPDAILLTPSHQYPRGGRMPVQERLAVLDWAERNHVTVLEDDYDSEFRHTRMPLPALASLPSNAEVILIGTFSKTLSPWLRCGYLVVRGTAGERIKRAREELDTPVSGILQSALADYVDGGGLARHIARARRQYAHRRALMLDRLGTRDGLELAALDGGLHAIIRIGGKVDARVVVEEALKQGVCVVALEGYFAEAAPENGLVIGYGAPSDLELARALDIITAIIDRMAKGPGAGPT
ncbi:PLP-dependent aminotransferase family protein [Arthrobacter celericrescens]|uniref:MocR-like pyridoxine biosynthesis transcription factor PdxR n=1 Tax=Arthrobacter celericrescens TaxID=2320851 RepID=UPI0013C44D72|nr:PLP-dependent aminotransferase family protein [Arthrobacter celericrescens]